MGAGCVPDDAAAHDACRRLQAIFCGGGDDDDAASEASTATTGTAVSGRTGGGGGGGGGGGTQGFRALEGGPILLDEMNRVSLHPSEIQKLGKNLIQVRTRVLGDCDSSDDDGSGEGGKLMLPCSCSDSTQLHAGGGSTVVARLLWQRADCACHQWCTTPPLPLPPAPPCSTPHLHHPPTHPIHPPTHPPTHIQTVSGPVLWRWRGGRLLSHDW